MFLAYNALMGVYSTSFCRSWAADLDGYEGFPCGFHSGQFGKWDCVPSHWMPLPPAPAQGMEAATAAETGTGSVHDSPVPR